MDLGLFYAINRWPEGFRPFFDFFSHATEIEAVKIGLILFLLVLLAIPGNTRRAGIYTLIAFPLANEITDLFKNYLPVNRPFQILEDVILRAGSSDSMGTASAHSANMAAVATVMVLCWRPWGWFWVPIAFFTGLSRVYVGVHFPLQVLLGWLVGVGTAWLVVKGGTWIETRWRERREARRATA